MQKHVAHMYQAAGSTRCLCLGACKRAHVTVKHRDQPPYSKRQSAVQTLQTNYLQHQQQAAASEAKHFIAALVPRQACNPSKHLMRPACGMKG